MQSGPSVKTDDTTYYAGKIGSYPVIVKLIHYSDQSYSGAYYYLNGDGLLQLLGKKQEKIVLVEKSEGKITGRFSLVQSEKGLKGSWTGKQKEMGVILVKFEIREKIPFRWKKKKLFENFYTLEFELNNEKPVVLNDTNIGGQNIQEIIEWKNSSEGYTGASGYYDSILWHRNGVMNIEHFFSYIGNTEYYEYRYDLLDIKRKKYFSPSEIFSDTAKIRRAAIHKLNDIVDREIKASSIESFVEDNEYPVASMENNRNNFEPGDLTNFYITAEGFYFYHDFFYNRLEEPFSPDDYIYFSFKEIRPFIHPRGPLNFLLIQPFQSK